MIPMSGRWYRNMAAQWRKLTQQHEEITVGIRLGPRLERDRQRLTR